MFKITINYKLCNEKRVFSVINEDNGDIEYQV